MNNIYDVYRIPTYDTKLFCEIYDNADSFVNDYKTSGLYNEANKITDENAALLFYLLYAKHGNDPVANLDINQFKYKMWTIIFQYGPTWEKRLDIQAKLRELTDADIISGSKAIYNRAYNPENLAGPTTTDEIGLEYVSEQNTTNYKRSKLEAYTLLWSTLKADVTSNFIKLFDNLFKQFVSPERTFIYETEYEDEQ